MAKKQRTWYAAAVGNLRTCAVSFRDHSGASHTAEVNAESLFEAAVLGVKAISQEWGQEPALMTSIRVEVKGPAVSHEVTFKDVQGWLNGVCRSPKERAVKERLKAILAA
jgi:hypothetical protein